MFSCCHPRLSEESQVALVLNILCGFGAGEIADAFLTGRAAIEKRISRGKKILAGSTRLFDLADSEFEPRLSAVLRAIYLLFSEGYHGSSECAVRLDVCSEAIRLAMLLLESPRTAVPETGALAALMCLQAARIPTRLDADGALNPLLEQDRSRWDARLMQTGLRLLEASAVGREVSRYHVEAAIAAAHVSAASVDQTDWNAIVGLYDRLMAIAPSPVVALNRAIAVGQRDGPERGLAVLRSIADAQRLRRYPFYPAAMGELERRRGDLHAARRHFRAAADVARNTAERRYLEGRLRECAAGEDDRSATKGAPCHSDR
jgi:RNA polymerase sigma-70 factor (ECF subfamily)